MVNLTSYFVGPAGAPMRIQAKSLAYATIGSGTYSTFTPSEIDFSGKIDAFGHDAQVTLKLTITGDATCDVSLNGHSLDGTYKVTDGNLYMHIASGPEKGTIEVQRWHAGAWVDPEIAGGHTIWIGP